MNQCFFRVVASGDAAGFEVITPEGERVAASPAEDAMCALTGALNAALDFAVTNDEAVVLDDSLQVSTVAIDCINCARFGLGQVVFSDEPKK